MGQKVVTMEQRLAAVFAEVAAGRATVVGVCAELGISRDRFYVYRRRFAEEQERVREAACSDGRLMAAGVSQPMRTHSQWDAAARAG
ncbi:hypothetical protein NBRGN_057_00990 [Nocardia brasiliensis NBRC 14402]|nr:hypothetical protein CEQ30_34005 [Nocardia brasiliensis]GAJ82595.1 hypothetical protein NBRGN_057_00990 [Nocardia brasiliensis NBRC 14402]